VEVVLVLVALILVSIGFAVTLGMLLFGSNRAAIPAHTSNNNARAELEDPSKARARFESELTRKQKELDEQRTQLQDVKEQLKQTKRKLFEQKEGEKGERDLIKARLETERHASAQLEGVRVELANALAEIERLRNEQGGGARPRRAPAPALAPAPASTQAATPAQPAVTDAPVAGQISAPAQEGERVVTAAVQVTPASEPAADKAPRRYRELNDADREKMERLEHTANKERTRATELERELRKVRGAKETQQRIYNAVKGELDLVKDKYKALEKRMNRTLLERDLVRRAIKDLEKKTGMLADRTELTPDEVAASDQRTEEAAKERSAAEAQRAAAQAQAEAEAAKATETAAPSESPAPTAEADKSTAPSA
jgi:chromosome segregation ATPase